jgi:hypothetical protein
MSCDPYEVVGLVADNFRSGDCLSRLVERYARPDPFIAIQPD